MKKPPVALFCMPEDGHFRLLCPLLSGLKARNVPVHVFTHRRFEGRVRRAGGIFVDLFKKYPLESADGESLPIPCRYVTFAAVYAEALLKDLHEIKPRLVIYETFSVVGRLSAALLGVPSVNVSPGHNLDPARFLKLLHSDPRVRIAPVCHRAVQVLRERYGFREASPFSYVAGLSPFLNICCEPQAYLTEEERRVFEPVAFFGSLPSLEELKETPRGAFPPAIGNKARTLKIYVGFGTVVWRYYATEAARAFRAISSSLEGRSDACALMSLGGAAVPPELLEGTRRPNVRVVESVDQRAVLAEADVFVTHHGINSTHEAVFQKVPMISHPFFWDQPLLADKCRNLKLAVPLYHHGLASTPHRPFGPMKAAVKRSWPLSEEMVRKALEEVDQSQTRLRVRLQEAQQWEREVIANRPAVLQLIEALA